MSNSIFEVPEKPVEVKVSYAETEKGPLVFYSDEEKKNYLKKENKAPIKTAVATFAYEGWSAFNATMRACAIRERDPLTGQIMQVYDTIQLRDMRLRKLLKGLVDGNGKTVEVTPTFINNLLPEFGMALMEAYNMEIENLRGEEPETDDEAEKPIVPAVVE